MSINLGSVLCRSSETIIREVKVYTDAGTVALSAMRMTVLICAWSREVLDEKTSSKEQVCSLSPFHYSEGLMTPNQLVMLPL